MVVMGSIVCSRGEVYKPGFSGGCEEAGVGVWKKFCGWRSIECGYQATASIAMHETIESTCQATETIALGSSALRWHNTLLSILSLSLIVDEVEAIRIGIREMHPLASLRFHLFELLPILGIDTTRRRKIASGVLFHVHAEEVTFHTGEAMLTLDDPFTVIT